MSNISEVVDDMTDPAVTQGHAHLRKGLSVRINVALAMAVIAPTSAILTTFSVVLVSAGTATLAAAFAAVLITLCVALCMAELGAAYPTAGGLYYCVERVLGRAPGFGAFVSYVGQAIFIPASVAAGVGAFVNSLVPSLSPTTVAGVVMIACTCIALLGIKENGRFAAGMLGLELLIVLTLGVVGFIHWHVSLSTLGHWQTAGPHGLTPVTLTAVVAAVAVALFAYNGYDAVIVFSEETQASRRAIGKAVMVAAGLAVALQLIPLIGIYFGAPSIRQLTSSVTGVTAGVRTYLPGIGDVITIGAIIALLNATLACVLDFSRIIWATARDDVWPSVISAQLGRVNRRGAPWVTTLLVGIVATVLVFQATLITVVTFTGVLVVLLYLLVAASAFWMRLRSHVELPFRMPLWPLAPVITVAGSLLVLSQQTTGDLLITGAITVGALLYIVLYKPGRATLEQAD